MRFNLGKAELAAFAVLLLRGSQTLNEVKTRASSMHPIETLEEAEAVLMGLAKRDEPLAELMPKRPGWKEPRWRDTVRVHGEDAAEGGAMESGGGSQDAPGSMRAQTAMQPGAGGRSKWDEFEDLKGEVERLKADYAALKEMVEKIKSELGG